MTSAEAGWFKQTLLCRCPRCASGPLFTGLLTIAPTCTICGLSLTGLATDDGPAALVILVLGFIMVGLALWVEVRFHPPFWLHAALWVPLIIAGGLSLLRVTKAWMVGQHYRHLADRNA